MSATIPTTYTPPLLQRAVLFVPGIILTAFAVSGAWVFNTFFAKKWAKRCEEK